MTNIDELKSTGLKATLPRLKILEIFQKGAQRHMTAEDVFRVLLEERSDIGLATVYRVLTQFEQAGILIRSNFESGKAVYELDEGQHHDHFVCTSCGKVEEFYDPEIEKRQQIIAKAKGWVVQDHTMARRGGPCAAAAGLAATGSWACGQRAHNCLERLPSLLPDLRISPRCRVPWRGDAAPQIPDKCRCRATARWCCARPPPRARQYCAPPPPGSPP